MIVIFPKIIGIKSGVSWEILLGNGCPTIGLRHADLFNIGKSPDLFDQFAARHGKPIPPKSESYVAKCFSNLCRISQLPPIFVELLMNHLLYSSRHAGAKGLSMDDQPQHEDIPNAPPDGGGDDPLLEAHSTIIKVSARSRSTAVAGAIAGMLRERRHAEVQAIGAGAVNQAVKALAIARSYLQGDAIELICVPYFTEVEIDGQERTAVRFIVEPR